MGLYTLRNYQKAITYLREKHFKRLIFAFSDEQLDERLKKYPELDKDTLTNIGGGCITDAQGINELHEFINYKVFIMEYFKQSDEFVHDYIINYLSDHEYRVSLDQHQVLIDLFNELNMGAHLWEANGISTLMVSDKNTRIIGLFNEAMHDYLH